MRKNLYQDRSRMIAATSIVVVFLIFPAHAIWGHSKHKKSLVATKKSAKVIHEKASTPSTCEDTAVCQPLTPDPKATKAPGDSSEQTLATSVTAGHSESHDHDGVLGLIGRLHPSLVHFPIAWLLLVLLVDAGTFFFSRRTWEKAGLLLLSAAAVSFVPAIATGLIRHSTHGETDQESLALILLDRNLMLAAAAACVLAFGIRIWRRKQLAGGIKALYLALIVTACALIALGGHLGGKVVFGPDYLPF